MPKRTIDWEPIADPSWNKKLSVIHDKRDNPVEFYISPPNALHVPLKMSHKGLASKVASFLFKVPKTDPIFLQRNKKDLIAHVRDESFSFTPAWIPTVCNTLGISILYLHSDDYSITYFTSPEPRKIIIIKSSKDSDTLFSLLDFKKSSKIVKCSFKTDGLPPFLSSLFDPTVFMSMHVKALLHCGSKKLTINDVLHQFTQAWKTPLNKDDKKDLLKIVRSHLESFQFFC